MATTFRIHEDENMKPKAGKVQHDAISANRAVLGDIQNNISRKALAVLKCNTCDSSSDSVSSGFIENIKALGLKDKPKFNKTEKAPFKELKNIEKESGVKLPELKNSSLNSFSVYVDSNDKENNRLTSVSARAENIIETNQKVVDIFQDEEANLCFPESSDCGNSFGQNEFCSERDSTSGYNSGHEISNSTDVAESPKVSRLEVSSSCIDSWYEKCYYKEEIFTYLLHLEKKFQPSAYYMRRQPQITHSMRTILVDWLVEVAEEYSLVNETIYIGVSLVDRFLSTMAITKEKLQLLGTASMWLAAKYEEVYPPSSGEFVYITDDSYTLSQLIRMEKLIMKVLNFDISCPTIFNFLTLLISCDQGPTKIMYLAMYLAELTLLDAEPYLEFFPSMIASAAVVLSRYCLDCKDIWPASYVKMVGYTLQQLVPVINHLNETHEKSFTRTHQAIRHKYATAKYRYISQVPFRRLTLRES